MQCQNFFIEKTDIFEFFKKMASHKFFIFSLWLVYVVRKIFPGQRASFPTIQNRLFWNEFRTRVVPQ